LDKIFDFILGLVFKSFVGQLIGMGVVLAGALSVGFFIYHLGYTNASNKCHQAAIQSQLDAEIIKEKNLQDQINAAVPTVVVINKKKQNVQHAADVATTVVTNEVKDNSSCDVGPDVTRVLNNLRASTGNN